MNVGMLSPHARSRSPRGSSSPCVSVLQAEAVSMTSVHAANASNNNRGRWHPPRARPSTLTATIRRTRRPQTNPLRRWRIRRHGTDGEAIGRHARGEPPAQEGAASAAWRQRSAQPGDLSLRHCLRLPSAAQFAWHLQRLSGFVLGAPCCFANSGRLRHVYLSGVHADNLVLAVLLHQQRPLSGVQHDGARALHVREVCRGRPRRAAARQQMHRGAALGMVAHVVGPRVDTVVLQGVGGCELHPLSPVLWTTLPAAGRHLGHFETPLGPAVGLRGRAEHARLLPHGGRSRGHGGARTWP
mmetsp:Transcript_123751/g.357959  ORF Transcript_123751/g.357959 Transcript_123751/m.357959 type:complete len:299 (-) Transcript_123751:112-1008(-)